MLVPELMRKDPKDRDIETLLAKIPFEKGQWLKGITKIFLKDNEVRLKRRHLIGIVITLFTVSTFGRVT